MVKQIKLVIKGRIPSKKNSRNIFVRFGKIVNIPSDKYREWHKLAYIQLPNKLIENIVLIVIDFFMPDNRKADLSNKTESLMDLLVDKGIIKDDSWQYVPCLIIKFCGVDKENPRAEITIKTSEEL